MLKKSLNQISLVTLCLFAVSAFSSVAWSSDNIKYVDDKRGYSIEFPASWKKSELENGFIGLSPVETSSDKFADNVNVVMQVLPSEMSTKQYFDSNIQNMQKFMTDFKVIEQGKVKINKNKARYLVYSWRTGEMRLKVLVYFLVQGSKANVITCSSTPQDFSKYRKQFEQISNTFRIQ